jgi:hypothetical protein
MTPTEPCRTSSPRTYPSSGGTVYDRADADFVSSLLGSYSLSEPEWVL